MSLPLQITNISKCFKDHKVLDSIDLTVSPGEIFGLVGVNGVGKTTLIKIMLDLLRPDSGEVSFFGSNAVLKSSRTNIAYLPEKFYPSPFLKGNEFLSLALSYYGMILNKQEALESAQMLGLDHNVLNHRIGKYSKGMGQKLGLISVFLVKRRLLVLDEPMSGLDPMARIQLKQLLLKYRDKGNTIFFSSHILADIEEICDNMAVIDRGKINFIGKPESFLSRYKESNLEKAFLKAIS